MAKKTFTPNATKAAASEKTTTATPKAVKAAVAEKVTKATPKAIKATVAEKVAKATPKVEKDGSNAKKNVSLDDSIIKDSKASKLSELLKKSNVSAKKPINFDKFAKELGWSSDDLSNSDLDLLEEESDDGMIYAEDGEFEDDAEDELSEISFEGEEEEEGEEDDEESASITDNEEEDLEEEDDSEADFQIVKTVTRGADPKSASAKFEFITQGKVALKALVSQDKKKPKNKLFPEESSGVYVDVKYKLPAFVSMSNGARKLIEIAFPERNPSNSSVCLILPDLSHNEKDKKDPDVDKQAREWADILRDKFGITGHDISKIVTLTQLKREVRDQKAKREFVQAYDILLVDRSIFSSIVYHLGNEVQKGGRLPIPFKVTARNVPEQLKKAYRVTQMDLRSGVGNVKIRIGNLTQGNNQLSANFVAVTDAIFAHAPFGHKNIKTAQIVTDQNAIQLPFYVDLSPKTELITTKPKKNNGEVIVDEVSTLPDNLKVKVENGVVRVIDSATGKNVIYPTHKDEHEPRDDIKPLPAAQIKGREKLAEKKEKGLKKLKMKRKRKNDIRRAAALKQKINCGIIEEKPKVEEHKTKQPSK
uniref:Uncharacterized protein n=1 Tax=Panagrolaimus sp. PS1159 TaxID=55785 RepID=A0AC35G029_9BILA